MSEPDLSKMLAGKKPARPEVIRALHRLADPHADPVELEAQAKETLKLFYGYLRQDNPELHRMYRLQDDNRRLQEEIDHLHTQTQTLESALREQRHEHTRVVAELENLQMEQVRTAADRTQLTELTLERDAALERITDLEESLRHAERAAAHYRQDLEHGWRMAEQAEHENTGEPAPGGLFDAQGLVQESLHLIQRGAPKESDDLLLEQAQCTPAEVYQLYRALIARNRTKIAFKLLRTYSARRDATDLLLLLLTFIAPYRDFTAEALCTDLGTWESSSAISDFTELLRAVVGETPAPELLTMVRTLAEVDSERLLHLLVEEIVTAERPDVLESVLIVSAAARDGLEIKLLELFRGSDDPTTLKVLAQAGVRRRKGNPWVLEFVAREERSRLWRLRRLRPRT
ncbi:hypothetical protein [Streptomyces sp. NPDC003006]